MKIQQSFAPNKTHLNHPHVYQSTLYSLSLFSIVQIIHIDIEEDIKHEFSMDFSRDISLL